jgi:hypothetical protein
MSGCGITQAREADSGRARAQRAGIKAPENYSQNMWITKWISLFFHSDFGAISASAHNRQKFAHIFKFLFLWGLEKFHDISRRGHGANEPAAPFCA